MSHTNNKPSRFFFLLLTVLLFMQGGTEQWYAILVRNTYLKYYGIFSPKPKEKNEEKKDSYVNKILTSPTPNGEPFEQYDLKMNPFFFFITAVIQWIYRLYISKKKSNSKNGHSFSVGKGGTNYAFWKER